MLDLSAPVLAHLQARGAQNAALLVWLSARDRDTNLIETIGFWTGADHETFTIRTVDRIYYGAGTVLSIPGMISEVGLQVRTTRVSFSSIAPEIEVAVRNYDLYHGRCEMHLAHFDPITDQLLAEPYRIYKGSTAGLEIIRPEIGGDARCELNLLGAARDLTRTPPVKKSDAALRNRVPGDGFRKYTDISGVIEAVWGEKRASAPPPAVSKASAGGTGGTDWLSRGGGAA